MKTKKILISAFAFFMLTCIFITGCGCENSVEDGGPDKPGYLIGTVYYFPGNSSFAFQWGNILDRVTLEFTNNTDSKKKVYLSMAAFRSGEASCASWSDTVYLSSGEKKTQELNDIPTDFEGKFVFYAKLDDRYAYRRELTFGR